MTAQVRFRDASGTLRTLVRCRVRDEEGNLRSVRRISIRDTSGVLQLVFRSMTAAASPTTLTGTGTTIGIVTSGSTTATPTGGTAPYTYLWKAADYNSDVFVIQTPTASSTSIKHNQSFSGETYTGDFYCTVTDALGDSADTGMVTVTITRT